MSEANNIKIIRIGIRNSIINVYDKKTHQNEQCQQIKTEWMKHCDILDRKNDNHKNKSYSECNVMFDSYYKCCIDDANNLSKHDKQSALDHHK